MNYEQIDLQIAERQAQKGFGKKHVNNRSLVAPSF